MAKLIKCTGCGEKISKNAKSCPHCGEPKAKSTSLLTWLVLILFIIGIFGSISPDSNTSSSSVSKTITTTMTAPKKPTKTEIEKKQKIKEQDIKYFKQTKEVIIEDINLKIQNKKYKEVMDITAKYLSFKGKDDDIIKINTEVRALLIKNNKEKQAKQKTIILAKTKIENKKKEKEILKKLKKIPSSDFSQNLKLYKTLLSYNPDNKRYKTKVKFYTDKINKEKAKKEKEISDRLVKFGKPPIASAWDGSYYVVEKYLEKVAKDPDSVKIASCTNVMHTKNGWLVGCTWRGRNGFGGMNVQSNWFTIRHNTVIRMDKASAY